MGGVHHVAVVVDGLLSKGVSSRFMKRLLEIMAENRESGKQEHRFNDSVHDSIVSLIGLNVHRWYVTPLASPLDSWISHLHR